MPVDSLIPGTVLQRGTPWLATTRHIPEPRLPQDDHRADSARVRTGRVARAFASLAR
jgi:hypothetical protein